MRIDGNLQNKPKILFVCTHNSARSQLAEGLMRDMFGERFEVYSCGTEKSFVKPWTIQAMADAGIDISKQYSKTFEEVNDIDFDYVVTVCDNAKESCPLVPVKGKVIHHSFQDPSNAPEEERLKAFCESRDEIKEWLIGKF